MSGIPKTGIVNSCKRQQRINWRCLRTIFLKLWDFHFGTKEALWRGFNFTWIFQENWLILFSYPFYLMKENTLAPNRTTGHVTFQFREGITKTVQMSGLGSTVLSPLQAVRNIDYPGRVEAFRGLNVPNFAALAVPSNCSLVLYRHNHRQQ